MEEMKRKEVLRITDVSLKRAAFYVKGLSIQNVRFPFVKEKN